MGSHKREICILAIVLIIIVALVAGLPFYLGGETTTGGENPEPEPTDAVTCESSNVTYPFITSQYGEISHEMSIKMIFQTDRLNSLGLYYDMHYGDDEKAQSAYNAMNAELNVLLGKAGLVDGQDLNVRYYKNQNDVGLSLYINKNNIFDDALLQFILLDVADSIPVEKSDFINSYETQGFVCTQTIK